MNGADVSIRQKEEKTLRGRTLFIPRMSIEGAATMAAAFRAVGVNGQIAPESDAHSLELARHYTIGEECYPEIVTLGSFLKVLENGDLEPEETAFLMPTAGGPCRFGQYKQLYEQILSERGLENVLVLSPTSADGYAGMGGNAGDLTRLGWWGIVCADAIRKLLLQTRPYEIQPGSSEQAHQESLDLVCNILEQPKLKLKDKLPALVDAMTTVAEIFSAVPAEYRRDKPLIGMVGEIYCRLDEFANANIIRRIEKFGGEVWLSAISEWVFYTNFMQRNELKWHGNSFSKSMLLAQVREKFQQKDERKLLAPLRHRFKGYEDPHHIGEFVKPAEKYLPYYGALGEMVLNVSGAIYLYGKGADGIVDISPFTCMNGIVCEAVYPKVSKEHENIPIRNFYFDGSEVDYDRDVEIFLELATSYQKRKSKPRVFPNHFYR